MTSVRYDLLEEPELLFTDKRMPLLKDPKVRYANMLDGYQQGWGDRYNVEITSAGDPVFDEYNRVRGEQQALRANGADVFDDPNRILGERHHIINISSVLANNQFMFEVGFFTDSRKNLIFLPNTDEGQQRMAEVDKAHGHNGLRYKHGSVGLGVDYLFRAAKDPDRAKDLKLDPETARRFKIAVHAQYSEDVDRDVMQIGNAYFAGDLSKQQAREQVAALVHSLRLDLMNAPQGVHINDLYNNRPKWDASKSGPAR